MDTKIIRKVASILMVAVIMGSTLSTPIVNIGKVVAETYSDTAESTDEVDANVTPESDVTTIESDITVPETPTNTVEADNSGEVSDTAPTDSTISGSPSDQAQQNIDTTEATDDSNKESSNSQPATTNDDTSKSDTTNVAKTSTPNSIIPTAPATNVVPTPPTPSGVCADLTNPKLNDMYQTPNSFNSLTFVYSSVNALPSGYIPDTITFYEQNDAGADKRTDALLGPINLSSSPGANDFNFMVQVPASNHTVKAVVNFTAEEIEYFLDHLKGNGSIGLKYVIKYKRDPNVTPVPGSPDCYEAITDNKVIEDFKYDFPKPDFNISPVCEPDCAIHFDFSETNANSQYYPGNADIVVLQDKTIVNGVVTEWQQLFRVDIGTASQDYTLNTKKYDQHFYKIYVDVDGDASATITDKYNPYSDVQELTLHPKPTYTDTLAYVDSSNALQVRFNIDLHENTGVSFKLQEASTTAGPWIDSDTTATNITAGGLVTYSHDSIAANKVYRIQITYGNGCHVDIPLTISPTPSIIPTQDCRTDFCQVNLDLGVTSYTATDKMIVTRKNNDTNVSVRLYGDVITSTLLNTDFVDNVGLSFDTSYTYTVQLVLNGSLTTPVGPSVSTTFMTRSHPTLTDSSAYVSSGNLLASADFNLNGNTVVGVKLQEAAIGSSTWTNVAGVADPTIVGGHISYTYANYDSAKMYRFDIIYANNCHFTIPLVVSAAPTVSGVQDCRTDICQINLNLGVTSYAATDKLIITRVNNTTGESVVRFNDVITSALLSNPFVDNLNLTFGTSYTYTVKHVLNDSLTPSFGPSTSVSIPTNPHPTLTDSSAYVSLGNLLASADFNLNGNTVVGVKLQEAAIGSSTWTNVMGVTDPTIVGGHISYTYANYDSAKMYRFDIIYANNCHFTIPLVVSAAPTVSGAQDCRTDICQINLNLGVTDYAATDKLIITRVNNTTGESVVRFNDVITSALLSNPFVDNLNLTFGTSYTYTVKHVLNDSLSPSFGPSTSVSIPTNPHPTLTDSSAYVSSGNLLASADFNLNGNTVVGVKLQEALIGSSTWTNVTGVTDPTIVGGHISYSYANYDSTKMYRFDIIYASNCHFTIPLVISAAPTVSGVQDCRTDICQINLNLSVTDYAATDKLIVTRVNNTTGESVVRFNDVITSALLSNPFVDNLNLTFGTSYTYTVKHVLNDSLTPPFGPSTSVSIPTNPHPTLTDSSAYVSLGNLLASADVNLNGNAIVGVKLQEAAIGSSTWTNIAGVTDPTIVGGHISYSYAGYDSAKMYRFDIIYASNCHFTIPLVVSAAPTVSGEQDCRTDICQINLDLGVTNYAATDKLIITRVNNTTGASVVRYNDVITSALLSTPFVDNFGLIFGTSYTYTVKYVLNDSLTPSFGPSTSVTIPTNPHPTLTDSSAYISSGNLLASADVNLNGNAIVGVKLQEAAIGSSTWTNVAGVTDPTIVGGHISYSYAGYDSAKMYRFDIIYANNCHFTIPLVLSAAPSITAVQDCRVDICQVNLDLGATGYDAATDKIIITRVNKATGIEEKRYDRDITDALLNTLFEDTSGLAFDTSYTYTIQLVTNGDLDHPFGPSASYDITTHSQPTLLDSIAYVSGNNLLTSVDLNVNGNTIAGVKLQEAAIGSNTWTNVVGATDPTIINGHISYTYASYDNTKVYRFDVIYANNCHFYITLPPAVHPTITAVQDCRTDKCQVNLDLGATGYDAVNDKIIITRVNKATGVEEKRYDRDITDALLNNLFEDTDGLAFDASYKYTIQLVLNGDLAHPFGPSASYDIMTHSQPALLDSIAYVSGSNLLTSVDLDVNDNTIVGVKLQEAAIGSNTWTNVVGVTDPTIVNGHISYTYASYDNTKVYRFDVIYANNCHFYITLPPAAHPTIAAVQDCRTDICQVNLDLGATGYENTDKIIITRVNKVTGIEEKRYDRDITDALLNNLFEDIDGLAFDTSYTYTIQLVLNGDLAHPFGPSASYDITTHSQPTLLDSIAYVSGNNLLTSVDLDVNDNTIVGVKLQEAAIGSNTWTNVVGATDPTIVNGHISYTYASYDNTKAYRFDVIYANNCHFYITLPPAAHPTITAVQDCRTDKCQVNLDLGATGYDAANDKIIITRVNKATGVEEKRYDQDITDALLNNLFEDTSGLAFDTSYTYTIQLVLNGDLLHPFGPSDSYDIITHSQPTLIESSAYVVDNSLLTSVDLNVNGNTIVGVKLQEAAIGSNTWTNVVVAADPTIVNGHISFTYDNYDNAKVYRFDVIYANNCHFYITLPPVAHPTITAVQDCRTDICQVNLDLGATGYENTDKIIITRVNKITGVEEKRYDQDITDALLNNLFEDTSGLAFDASYTYTIQLVINGNLENPFGPSASYDIMTHSEPEPSNVFAYVESDILHTSFDVDINENTIVSVKLQEASSIEGEWTNVVPNATISNGHVSYNYEDYDSTKVYQFDITYGNNCHVYVPVEISARPSVNATQSCDGDCLVDLTFDAPEGAKVIIKRGNTELYKDVMTTDILENGLKDDIIKAVAADPNDSFTNPFDNFTYTIQLVLNGDLEHPFGPTTSYGITTHEKPEITNFEAFLSGSKIGADFGVDFHNNSNPHVYIQLDNDIEQRFELTKFIIGGHITSELDVAPSEHTIQIVLTYGEDCEIIKPMAFSAPAPTITTKQDCTNDCKVDLSFGFEDVGTPDNSQSTFAASSTLDNSLFASVASTLEYPEGSIMIVKRDGVVIYSGSIISTLSDVVPAYNTGTSLHTYTVQIAYNGSVTNPFGPVNTNTITLYKMAEVTNPMAYISNGRLHTSFDINLFSDPNAKVAILLDGETFDVTNIINSGHVVYDLEVAPGEHTVSVVINAITGCVITIPLTLYSAAPAITAVQDCDNDCKVDLSFATEDLVYPDGSQMIVMRGDEIIYEGDIVSSLTDIVPAYDTNDVTYKYNVAIIYGGDMVEPFGPTSSLEFTLLKKPEIKSVNMRANSDTTITVDYKNDLNGYPNATGTLVITGSNGYTKTIDIDSMDLLSGSFTTEKLEAGTYDATFTINYSESCKPIVLEAEPVKIEEPKLVYTGLESNLFEAIIIEIKEIFVNAA